MSQSPTPESIALYFQQGSSDKEYQVHLKEDSAKMGWLVEIQYGKRGSALRSALKTKDPIPFTLAKSTYDKVVMGQLKDGYTPSGSGQAYQDTPREKLFTGVIPQLLNSVDEADFGPYYTDPAWMLQEKFDGQRLMLRKSSSGVEGINRDGLLVAVPSSFAAQLASLASTSCLLDGEWLGDRFAAFDLLELDGADLRPLPAKERKARLDKLVASLDESVFIRVTTAFTEQEKHAMHDQVRSALGEGVVGKRVDSPYTPGRPNSGGAQIKRKFVESATVVVRAQHATKRSISVCTRGADGSEVERGSVTIPANYAIPPVGAIVEVQYLYAYRDGSLYQPVYKGPRVDQGIDACVCSQLKFKSDTGPATAPKTPRLRA